MNPKTLLTFLLVAAAISLQAQIKTVDLPHAAFANNRALEISKVTLSDTTTVLDVEAFFTPGYWIKIASDTYLLADGKSIWFAAVTASNSIRCSGCQNRAKHRLNSCLNRYPKIPARSILSRAIVMIALKYMALIW